jgi:putative hydrolase of the HAD superfamily
MKKGDTSEAKVKAIIFDVGGVLQLGGTQRLNPKRVHTSGVHQIISKKLGITIDQYLDSIDTAYAKSMEGQISRSTLLSVLSLNLNYPKEKLEALFVKTYKKIYKKNKELFSIAKKLKKQGYKIAILSDQWHLSKDALMQKKDFNIFDKQVVSCDVGKRKPNPEIYQMILDKLNLEPKETIFIDNQIWNLLPAHKMGMKTILFTKNKKLKEQLSRFGVYFR